MIIHQILINETKKLPSTFPDFHIFCYEQIKKLYPNEKYHLYSGEEIEEIIKKYFDEEVFLCYKKLKPFACKADLARYCLLYLYGGIYADLNTYFVNKITPHDSLEFFAFRDNPRASMQSWAVHNGIIYSQPKSKPLENAINLIKLHCREEYYGVCSIDVTATTVLGRSICLSKPNLNIATTGQLCHFHPQKYFDKEFIDKFEIFGYDKKKFLGFFLDSSEEIVAIKKSSKAGDISSLGFEKTNNYDQMWRNFDVYDTSICLSNSLKNNKIFYC
jgi:hypothetical protein